MYEVIVQYLGDFSVDKNDVKLGKFGPFESRKLAEKAMVAVATQPAQHFWAIVGAELHEVSA